MRAATGEVAELREAPRAKVARKSRFQWIWVVPIVAGAIGAWLVFENVKKNGPTIAIRFEDGRGIQPGQTMIRYRGVRVGEVSSAELTGDMKAVDVKVQLDRSSANLAREGSSFWIVKADVTGGTISGLDTIMGGPYIEALPGNGAPKKEFDGLKQTPAITTEDDPGVDITLAWPQLGWLNPGAPLYYRGVEVGVVRDYSLGEEATNILIHAHIHQRFAPLVRQNSKFWNAGGIKADISLFHGVSVSAETLKSLLVGGIAFATPNPPGSTSVTNQVFELYEKPEEKWTKWSPAINIGSPKNESQTERGVNFPPLNDGKTVHLPRP